MVELQNRLSEESKKADKMEFEYKRVKEKVDSLQKEKDVCTVNLNNIRTVKLWKTDDYRNITPYMSSVLFL